MFGWKWCFKQTTFWKRCLEPKNEVLMLQNYVWKKLRGGFLLANEAFSVCEMEQCLNENGEKTPLWDQKNVLRPKRSNQTALH